jgi:hypothetical protein
LVYYSKKPPPFPEADFFAVTRPPGALFVFFKMFVSILIRRDTPSAPAWLHYDWFLHKKQAYARNYMKNMLK